MHTRLTSALVASAVAVVTLSAPATAATAPLPPYVLWPAHWPCAATVTWAVSDGGVPGARATAEHGVDVLAADTGLRFVEQPPTSLVPQSTTTAQPAQVVIAWAPAGATDLLRGQDWDGWTQLRWTAAGVITQADVVIDPAAWAARPAGFDRPNSQGWLMLHELGHVVGLGDDTANTVETMFPNYGWTHQSDDYQAGDKQGFAAQAALGGCPAPAPVIAGVPQPPSPSWWSWGRVRSAVAAWL